LGYDNTEPRTLAEVSAQGCWHHGHAAGAGIDVVVADAGGKAVGLARRMADGALIGYARGLPRQDFRPIPRLPDRAYCAAE
jgi:hypothetical protein